MPRTNSVKFCSRIGRRKTYLGGSALCPQFLSGPTSCHTSLFPQLRTSGVRDLFTRINRPSNSSLRHGTIRHSISPTEGALPLRLDDLACRESGSTVTMAPTWCRCRTPVVESDHPTMVAGRKQDSVDTLSATVRKYCCRRGRAEAQNWSPMSPERFDLTRRVMGSRSISGPRTLAGRESTPAALRPAGCRWLSRAPMGLVRRSPSTERRYFCKPPTVSDTEESGFARRRPGADQEVDRLPSRERLQLWALSQAVLLCCLPGARSLRYFDFATGQLRPVFEIDNDIRDGSLYGLSRWPVVAHSLVWRDRQRRSARRSLRVVAACVSANECAIFTVSATTPSMPLI